ncbi:MAG: error-prone DNA polymerase, partial [Rhizobiales bacterium]|nr:error-prone DNA polymerase [Hyphomicrobiales bacterium]
ERGCRYAIGTRLVFRDGTPEILAWPTDRAAWGQLCRLLSAGNLRAPKGECHLDFGDLLEWGSGLMLGVVPGRDPGRLPAEGAGARVLPFDRSLAPAPKDVPATLAALKAAFPGNVRLMANRLHGSGDQRRLARLARIGRHYGVPLVATNDVLYHHPDRRPLQDVLTCIREHCTIAEAGRRLEANAERHLKPGAEMARLFAGYPEAIAQSLAVLERLDFSLDQLAYNYPDEPTGAGETPQETLARLAAEGAAWRYPDGVPDKVRGMVAHELALIAQKQYALYFLTVHDIVRFARSREILCQGRGSAANSAVCFCLGITEVNPETSDLLFERFISPERDEPPDIDVDFEHERREEVMQYIYGKYGRDRAGIAATVISYRTRSALREVGKAFGLSDDTIGALSGTIWGISSEGVREGHVREVGIDPAGGTMQQVLALSKELIGFPRHLSQHVGGFVITRDRLDEMVPVMNAAMEKRTHIEWDKDDLDTVGMLKVDVLALGMLSCIRRAFELMRRHYGWAPDLAAVHRAQDPAVYDMICRADTLGVFQIESRAQMTMLPRLRPRVFYDLVIEVAIVRPGPIQGDMVHPYLRRRQRLEEVVYPAPSPDHGPADELERVLGRTLGVPLFQEQAMKIAIVAAGFTPSEADKLRRAMATFRRTGTIHTFRDKMIEGMTARGYERAFAERCFQQIEGFGEYGFPESHAASFALLVYASCWIKCHYPDVFCAALLNAQPMGFYAPAQIVRDATRHGVAVRAVDVNFSAWDATLEDGVASFEARSPSDRAPQDEEVGALREGNMATAMEPNPIPHPEVHARIASLEGRTEVSPARHIPLHPVNASMADEIRATHSVRLGLRQIKGFAEDDAAALVAARGRGYDSIRDLWLRSGLGRAAIERLADADAFRSLGLDRLDALWAARDLGGGRADDRLPLFDVAAHADIRREPDVALPPMPVGEHVVNDYRYLSLSLKAHPVSFVRPGLAARGIVANETLRDARSGRRVTVAGLAIVRQRPGTASGVIFMTIEDETDIANIVVWPKLFERFRPVVLGARFVAVTGKVQSERDVIHVVADRLEDLTGLLGVLSAEPDARPAPGELIDARARADEVRRPGTDTRERVDRRAGIRRHPRNVRFFEDGAPADPAAAKATGAVMPKGRNFH